MAQKIRCTLIRDVRREWQEGQHHPAYGAYLPLALSSIPRAHPLRERADRSYQLQVHTSRDTSYVDSVSTETLVDSSTDFHSSNLSFFHIAIQIKRSCMAIVANQEEFCCGPRQGN